MNYRRIEAKFNRLKSNKIFETFVIFVIIFSALVIGAKTYDLPVGTTRFIILLDWLITLFFFVEITVRFLGERNKKAFFKNAWNIFDTLIVIVSVIPIEDSELALVGRLIRIFRVLRMVSLIPELRLLLNSLAKALPKLGYVMLLMFIIFYIYAAIGSTFFAHINPNLWGDISISMLTLFRVMTFEDWTDVMYETMAIYKLSWAYYISFIFLTAFAFLNMIIGIMLSVMEQEQRALIKEGIENEDEEFTKIKEELNEVKSLLHQVLEKQQSTSRDA